MEDIGEQLKERIAICNARDSRNYFTAFSLLVLSVLTSAATAVAVATDFFSKGVIAGLAATPGIFILIGATFRFEQRARWYWQKRSRLERLLRRHLYENLPVAETSKFWSEIDDEMFSEWPGFGSGFSSKGNGRPEG